MNLRSFDGIMGLLSIPLSLFGMYITYYMYISGDIARLTFFAIMTALTLTKAFKAIRGSK